MRTSTRALRGLALGYAAVIAAAAYAQDECPGLTWADEFDGERLDTTSWSYQLGDGTELGIPGWGNNELQFYRAENAAVANGELAITARPEEVGGYDYTSARLRTAGKVDVAYGRIEGRIRVPAGGGTWPALWMLSTEEPYGTWPRSGEIDVMEYVGNAPGELLGTVHYGADFASRGNTSKRVEFFEGELHEAFHDFAVDWSPDTISWLFDGYRYGTVTRADVEAEGRPWPFDHEFHLLLNLAVGGNLGGAVDPAAFPADLRVDYVRIYEGERPYLTGPRDLPLDATEATYAVGGVDAGTAVSWSLPDGARVVAGAGTTEITVDFSAVAPDAVGTVSAELTGVCGATPLRVDVRVSDQSEEGENADREYGYTIENFDSAGATVVFQTGVLETIADPVPDDTLATGQVGSYTRNADQAFDVLVYDLEAVDSFDAAALTSGEDAFSLDLRTAAAPGSEIVLQLETPDAAGADFPIGRQSRYLATVPEGNADEFRRLTFAFDPVLALDPSASPDSVSQLVILFASGTNTGDVFEFDNLDVYVASAADTAGGEQLGDTVSLDGLAELYVIDDIDGGGAERGLTSGTFDTFPAPEGDALASGQAVRYGRDSANLFDVIYYDPAPVDGFDAGALAAGEQLLGIDLATDAPAGTRIIAQLETPAAGGSNFPTGRYARFLLVVPEGSTSGEFRRLGFTYLNQPDPNTRAEDVNSLVLLFAPNTNTGDVYAFENFAVYEAPDSATSVRTPHTPTEAVTVAYDVGAARMRLQLEGSARAAARAEGARVDVIDMRGRVAASVALPADGWVDVAALPRGTYAVRVRAGARAYVGRFVR